MKPLALRRTAIYRRWHSLGGMLVTVFLLALAAFTIREVWLAVESGAALHAQLDSLAVAGAVYMAGHLLRALRLAIILGQSGFSLRQIVCFHFYTSATSLLLPWKTGDLYRIAELTRFTGGLPASFLAVWIERFFDIGVFLLMVAVVLLVDRGVFPGVYPIVRLSLLFVVASFLIFVLLPENLNALRVFILRRYRGERAVQAQRLTLKLQELLSRAALKLKSHVATLCTLSAMVWACELGAFYIGIAGAKDSLLDGLRGMLLYLGTISNGHVPEIANTGDSLLPLGYPLFSYLLATRLPLLLAALACGIIYKRKLNRQAFLQ